MRVFIQIVKIINLLYTCDGQSIYLLQNLITFIKINFKTSTNHHSYTQMTLYEIFEL